MTMSTITGCLSDKMTISQQAGAPLNYVLHLGEHSVDMNTLRGKQLSLTFTGRIFCIGCGIQTPESHNQGYCEHCAATLAKCDTCAIKPETCHYAQGTCREPSWGGSECLQDHIVYLSYTSSFKVGITREKNLLTRWADQGAMKATPLFRVSQRLYSGLVEQVFAELVSDKTNWRTMLLSDVAPTDEEINAEALRLCGLAQQAIEQLQLRFGEATITRLPVVVQSFTYPMGERPMQKMANPHNFDKSSGLSGQFLGLKGQYAFVGNTVVNLRKYAGYELMISEN